MRRVMSSGHGAAWLLLFAALSLTIIVAPAQIVAQSKSATGDPIWIYDSDLYVKHVETADLNSDGVPDVIGAEYDNTYYGEPSRVIAVDGLTGDTLWTYLCQDGVRSLAVGDITNDSIPDVIAGASFNGSGTSDGDVHAINGADGSELWVYPINSTVQTLAIGEFNNDHYRDVVAGCFDDYIYAISGQDGSLIWSEEVPGLWINDVATGDVNGDNLDDVAFAEEYLTGFTNYFGMIDGSTGDRIWADTVDYVSLSVVMADIDDDGSLEAIFGHFYDDNHCGVVVYTAANGDVEWSYNLGAGTSNSDVILGVDDLDGDNDLDLVVGVYVGSYFVTAFDGEGDTPYWVSQELDGYPKDFGFGDIDGNGEEDVLISTYDRVQVLFGESGKKYWYYAVGGTISEVTAADVDNDDTLEVIACGGADDAGTPPNPGKSIWALNTIVSPVLWEHNFGQYGNGLAVADITGRAYADVITVSSLDDRARAINGASGGELWTYTGTENLYAITSGDFNNDGTIDVAVGGADDQVTALTGTNGSVLWSYPVGDQIYRKCLKSTDLNGDNAADVIAGCDAGVVYALNGPDGDTLWTYALGGQATDVKLYQMNGVGPLDVVVGVGASGAPAQLVVLNGEDGDLLWSYAAPGEVEHVAPLDGNNDGVPDVAIAITPFNPKQVMVIDGSTHLVLWTQPIASASNTQSMDAGDLNGDKFDDVVVPGNSTDRNVWALSGEDGSTLWAYPTGGEVNCVMVYDVDNDGQQEVVAGSDDQVIYVLDGSSGDLEWSFSTADDVMDIGVGDISGDGLPNLACLTFGSDGVAYAFESLATEPLNQPPLTPPMPNGPTAVAVGMEATYSTSTTDPDGDAIYYGWDFEGTTIWDGPYASGATASYAHTWATAGVYDVKVSASDEFDAGSEFSPPLAVTVYVCGDPNGDGIANVTDAVYLITYIFADGPGPDPYESGDPNCDGIDNVTDAVYLITWIFAGGPAPCENCP